MKKITTLLAALLIYTVSFSQDYLKNPVAPNQEAIRTAILSTSSQYFYPLLFERYQQGDTTLNIEDYRHLYYGYVYQDNYRPLELLNYTDSITLTLAQNQSDSVLTENVIGKLEYYIDKAFKAEPFNMNYLNFMTFIKESQGDIEQAKIYATKLQMIKSTILSSGDGLTKNSPWHVLYNSDEKDILNSLGVTYSKPILSSAHVEYFHIPGKNHGNKGYYFDISRRYMKPVEGVAPDPNKRFEINPTTNPKSSKYQKFNLY
ncbi:MAG: DUF4919 domain-containing protein [Rikenellaceae bacterium]